MDLDTLQEKLYNSYKENLDIALCFKLHKVKEEQQEAVLNDAEFLERLEYVLAQEQQENLRSLKKLRGSYSDSVSLKATLEWGKIFDANRFSGKPIASDKEKVTSVTLKPYEAPDES